MEEKKMSMIFSEDSIVMGNLFFVTSAAMKKQTSLAQEAFKDMMENINFN